jgi:hypothetical protein
LLQEQQTSPAPKSTHKTKQNKTEEKKHQTTLEDEAEEDDEEEDYFALIQRITQKSKLGSVARLLDPRTEIYVLLIYFL